MDCGLEPSGAADRRATVCGRVSCRGSGSSLYTDGSDTPCAGRIYLRTILGARRLGRCGAETYPPAVTARSLPAELQPRAIRSVAHAVHSAEALVAAALKGPAALPVEPLKLLAARSHAAVAPSSSAKEDTAARTVAVDLRIRMRAVHSPARMGSRPPSTSRWIPSETLGACRLARRRGEGDTRSSRPSHGCPDGCTSGKLPSVAEVEACGTSQDSRAARSESERSRTGRWREGCPLDLRSVCGALKFRAHCKTEPAVPLCIMSRAPLHGHQGFRELESDTLGSTRKMRVALGAAATSSRICLQMANAIMPDSLEHACASSCSG